jgi:hypothetical protein
MLHSKKSRPDYSRLYHRYIELEMGAVSGFHVGTRCRHRVADTPSQVSFVMGFVILIVTYLLPPANFRPKDILELDGYKLCPCFNF